MNTPPPDPLQTGPAGQATFGELLRQHRLAAGLSEETLAERAGLSARGLSLLENGKRQAPYRHTVTMLARALALSPDAVDRLETTVLRSRMPVSADSGSFPPRDLPPAPRTNLPLQLTSFTGRAREVAEIQVMLAATRLLTLTGSGGVGKTRLALEVAAAQLDRYPDGVWFVELSPLSDPTLVPASALAALEIPEQPGNPPLQTLLAALRTRQALVLLDNCEHLLDACARLSAALLRGCHRLQILATSREPLGLGGEQRWRVPSLSLPALDQVASLEIVGSCEAVQLFLERARTVQPQFVLSAANVREVARVCTRLDGIPLALELAAARLGGLGLPELVTRLDQRFRLLTRGQSDALPRQQTLLATVAWSYALLTSQEQTLFARLSVFVGGWSLDAAEVVAVGQFIAAEEVPDLLARLVEKSLVTVEELEDGTLRYGLLETLRQYGHERLPAGGETACCQRRHAEYYLVLAERAEPALTGAGQQRWLGRLVREHENLRAALAWYLHEADYEENKEAAQAAESSLRLAGALFWFWFYLDHQPEGLGWLDRALVRGAAAPAAVRAKALFSAGVFAWSAHDLAYSQALLTQSVALSREVGDRRQLVLALGSLGVTLCQHRQEKQAADAVEESVTLARATGEPALLAYALLHVLLRVTSGLAIGSAEEHSRARVAGEEALRLYQVVGDRMSIAMVQLLLGQLALYAGDHEHARASFVASLPMFRALGLRSTVADVLVRVADVTREQGAAVQAAALYREGLMLYRQVGDHLSPAIAAVLSRLAAIALEQSDWAAAQTHVTECLAIARDTGRVGVPETAGALEVQAALAAFQGAPLTAARLAGAAATLRAHHHRPLAASEQATLERWLASARQALSADEQAAAWAAGQTMTRDQAIAYALDGPLSAHGAPRAEGSCL